MLSLISEKCQKIHRHNKQDKIVLKRSVRVRIPAIIQYSSVHNFDFEDRSSSAPTRKLFSVNFSTIRRKRFYDRKHSSQWCNFFFPRNCQCHTEFVLKFCQHLLLTYEVGVNAYMTLHAIVSDRLQVDFLGSETFISFKLVLTNSTVFFSTP